MRNIDLSIVIPVYNEEESLELLYNSIINNLQNTNLNFEIIFIDDGSSDNSWDVIKTISEKKTNLSSIKFKKNYGKSDALDAGFKASNGTYVLTMDADLQDDIPSKFFNLITRIFSGIKLNDFNCGIKIYKKELVNSVNLYGEMHRYIPLIAKWNGYDKIGEKVVNHNKRKFGQTKFGMERYIRGFLDLISVSFVYRFRKRPMHFFGSLGVISFLIGLISVGWIIYEKLSKISNNIPLDQIRPVTDQPLFYIALVTIIVGVQLFLVGFISELIISINSDKNGYIIEDSDIK